MNDAGQRLQILVVEVPSAGSPKVARDMKPGPYPQQRREHWQPRTRPPSKAERLGRFLDSINEQEAALREMLTPSPRAWFDVPTKDTGP